jgi:hypothetical protein
MCYAFGILSIKSDPMQIREQHNLAGSTAYRQIFSVHLSVDRFLSLEFSVGC